MTKSLNIFSKTVRGSTIIETMVSLVILFTVLSLFLLNIDKVNQSLNPYSIYQAYEISENFFNTIDIAGQAYQKTNQGRFVIERSIDTLIENELYKLEITIYDNGNHRLLKKQKIISTKKNL